MTTTEATNAEIEAKIEQAAQMYSICIDILQQISFSKVKLIILKTLNLFQLEKKRIQLKKPFVNIQTFLLLIYQKTLEKSMSQDLQQQQNPLQSEIKFNNIVGSLKVLHKDLNQDLIKMSQLKDCYFQIQEKKFLVTFVNIMDRMSDQLQKANDQYQNINKEIEGQQECKMLSKQLQYFQGQCVNLKKALEEKKDKLQREKQREKSLKFQQQLLQKQLFHQTYKEKKYQTKISILNKQKTAYLSQQKYRSKNSYNSRSKSIRQKSPSMGVNEHMYEQIYAKRPKSLRHMTSYRMQKRVSTTMFTNHKKSANALLSFKQS